MPWGSLVPEKSQESFSQPSQWISSADWPLLQLLGPCHCSAALWQARTPLCPGDGLCGSVPVCFTATTSTRPRLWFLELCQVRGVSSKLTSVLCAGVRAEEGMEGRLIISMGATAWDLQLGWDVCAVLFVRGVSEHPTISITMLSELQAATGNSGHNVMLYGTGNNLPC